MAFFMPSCHFIRLGILFEDIQARTLNILLEIKLTNHDKRKY